MTTIKKNEWTGITKVEIFWYQADSDVFYFSDYEVAMRFVKIVEEQR